MNVELGYFDSEEEAAYAYNVAAEILNNERVELNNCPNLTEQQKEVIFNQVNTLLKGKGLV